MAAINPVPLGDDEYKPEAVTTKLGRIRFDQIDDDPANFAFRDDDELTDAGIKALAEDIAVNDLTTPLLVAKRESDRYLLINGHRRRLAILLNIKQGVIGFTVDMLVPVFVIDIGASRLALVARAVAANVQQRSLSGDGRRKAISALKQLGMPNKEIARCVGASEQTVERELALASSGCMLDHVRNHNITGTYAAILVKAATDAGRMDDLCEAFAEWEEQTRAKIAAEQKRRKDADEDPLSLTETWPSRYFTAEQAATWKTAFEKGLPLTPPSFRFRAQVKEEKGERHIIIDSVKMPVSKIPAKDLAKIYVRFVDFAAEIKPILEEKARAEAAAQPAQATAAHAGRDALQELGLGHLVESAADEAEGEPPFDVEVNLAVVEGSDAATDAPVAATDAPVATTDAPVATTDAPVTATDAPVTATDTPVAATDAPVEITAVAEPQQGATAVQGESQAAAVVEGELDELSEKPSAGPPQEASGSADARIQS